MEHRDLRMCGGWGAGSYVENVSSLSCDVQYKKHIATTAG